MFARGGVGPLCCTKNYVLLARVVVASRAEPSTGIVVLYTRASPIYRQSSVEQTRGDRVNLTTHLNDGYEKLPFYDESSFRNKPETVRLPEQACISALYTKTLHVHLLPPLSHRLIFHDPSAIPRSFALHFAKSAQISSFE